MSHAPADTARMEKPLSYKPSAYYYRKALREAETVEDIQEICEVVATELEMLKAWVRTHGLVPPRWHVTPSERAAKAPGSVVPFPTTTAESGKGD